MSIAATLEKGLLTGIVAGFASGLLGVSPGGILVPVISLLLGFDQHLAQAVSLIAQAPPTSLSGISDYTRRGRGTPIPWIALISAGFLGGSPAGAALTRFLSDSQLRWMFVGYLLILALIAIIRGRRPKPTSQGTAEPPPQIPWLSLVLIGVAGGLSSGLLGIGGGLAITAFSTLLIGLNQHQAQALALIVTAFPLTLPAAWVYTRQGVQLPWWAIGGIVLGLTGGSKAGAMVANKLPETTLRFFFIALIVAMAIYMAVAAYQ